MLNRKPFFSIYYLLFPVSYLVQVLSTSGVIFQHKFNHAGSGNVFKRLKCYELLILNKYIPAFSVTVFI